MLFCHSRLARGIAFPNDRCRNSSIVVRVLLFASYADRLGVDSLEVSVVRLPPSAASWSAFARFPEGSELPPRPLCARNLAHVALDEPVTAGDEIAVLPPLAGG